MSTSRSKVPLNAAGPKRLSQFTAPNITPKVTGQFLNSSNAPAAPNVFDADNIKPSALIRKPSITTPTSSTAATKSKVISTAAASINKAKSSATPVKKSSSNSILNSTLSKNVGSVSKTNAVSTSAATKSHSRNNSSSSNTAVATPKKSSTLTNITPAKKSTIKPTTATKAVPKPLTKSFSSNSINKNVKSSNIKATEEEKSNNIPDNHPILPSIPAAVIDSQPLLVVAEEKSLQPLIASKMFESALLSPSFLSDDDLLDLDTIDDINPDDLLDLGDEEGGAEEEQQSTHTVDKQEIVPQEQIPASEEEFVRDEAEIAAADEAAEGSVDEGVSEEVQLSAVPEISSVDNDIILEPKEDEKAVEGLLAEAVAADTASTVTTLHIHSEKVEELYQSMYQANNNNHYDEEEEEEKEEKDEEEEEQEEQEEQAIEQVTATQPQQQEEQEVQPLSTIEAKPSNGIEATAPAAEEEGALEVLQPATKPLNASAHVEDHVEELFADHDTLDTAGLLEDISPAKQNSSLPRRNSSDLGESPSNPTRKNSLALPAFHNINLNISPTDDAAEEKRLSADPATAPVVESKEPAAELLSPNSVLSPIAVVPLVNLEQQQRAALAQQFKQLEQARKQAKEQKELETAREVSANVLRRASASKSTEQPPEKSREELLYENYRALAANGIAFTKIGRSGKPKLTLIFITQNEEGGMFMQWESKKKSLEDSSFYLPECQLFLGPKAGLFTKPKYQKLFANRADSCFSVVAPHRSLDLVAEKAADYEVFVTVLKQANCLKAVQG
jgi:hypothetical protein